MSHCPSPGFKMRASDPRSSFFGISYQDYAQPLGGQFVQRFASRHRIEKKNPGAARSEPVKPIVYYVDNTAPEPIRTALVEGARWWNQAFEAAGYINGFRVEVLPDSIDPLDVRYNVIEYAHRATRGWSYGGAVTDPRTGEMMKGHVILGSLRARQDFLHRRGARRAICHRHREGGACRGDGAVAHPPALRARSGSHAGHGAQLHQQRAEEHQCDGLSASDDLAQAEWRCGYHQARTKWASATGTRLP